MNPRRVFRLLGFAFTLMLAGVPAAFGQDTTGEQTSTPPVASVGAATVSVAAGEKAEVKGTIVERTDKTFLVRDEHNGFTEVVLTDETSVKTKGGIFHRHKEYGPDNLIRGLKVEVEGRGNSSGQLEARKIRFHEHDMDVARSLEYRVSPLEGRVTVNEAGDQVQAGQIDELNEGAKIMRRDIDRNTQAIAATDQRVTATNERITSIDDFEVAEQATLLFKVNSAKLTDEAKVALDQFAQRALTMTGYVIEVAGFTDSTGSETKNRTLSHLRADAVAQYLAEVHKIPLRRLIVPLGYGESQPMADNATPEGREQNRRVEVRVLVSKGLVSPN